MATKRTRPRAQATQTQVAPPKPKPAPLLALNAPFPGCCTPYPDARFEDQRMVELYDHHNGPQCKGYMEPRSVEDWNAELERSRVRVVSGAE